VEAGEVKKRIDPDSEYLPDARGGRLGPIYVRVHILRQSFIYITLLTHPLSQAFLLRLETHIWNSYHQQQRT
jgi:hypothetical protein